MDPDFHTRTAIMLVSNAEDSNKRLQNACARLQEFFSLEDNSIMESEAQAWEEIVETAQKDRRKSFALLSDHIPNWPELYTELAGQFYQVTQEVACAQDQIDAIRSGANR